MTARVVINDQALRNLLLGQNGPVAKKMYDVGRQIQNEAKRRCPVDEGRLRASIENTLTTEGSRIIVRVGTRVEYAQYVHNGTGVYGPEGKPIVPLRTFSKNPTVGALRAAALRWVNKGGETVFARYSRGTRPNPFLTDAFKAVMRSVGWPVRERRPTGGAGKGAG